MLVYSRKLLHEISLKTMISACKLFIYYAKTKFIQFFVQVSNFSYAKLAIFTNIQKKSFQTVK